RILGTAPDAHEVNNESLLAFVHPDDRERVLAARAKALEGGDIPEVEHRIVRPDGTIRHVVQRAKLVRDANGEPEMLYGTIQDVSEHRRIEEEVRTRARQQEAVSRLGQQALKENNLHAL